MSLSIIGFGTWNFYPALSCHHSILPIYVYFKDHPKKWFLKYTRLSLVLCVFVYLVTSYAGLLTFGADINANFFVEYCIYDVVSMLTRIFNVLSLTATEITQILSIEENILELPIIRKYSKSFGVHYFLIMMICGSFGLLSYHIRNMVIILDIVVIIAMSPCVYMFYPLALMCRCWKILSRYSKCMCLMSMVLGSFLITSGIYIVFLRQNMEIYENIPKYWCEEALIRTQ
ncbi:hypothetical protein RF11_01645 [Thelohanellus kitauei]|uniref:Amino acid transporter transmembrane domain-containing protein n=1 Tax=Thelohanellus kitauei TaxID=669202 RepID=A0A0C2N1G3_THEKT|nr:hypothetical protein RF11_01645 [Thelohanellus kitauei]